MDVESLIHFIIRTTLLGSAHLTTQVEALFMC